MSRPIAMKLETQYCYGSTSQCQEKTLRRLQGLVLIFGTHVQIKLADKYPEHVLTKWLGNTPKVAKEHYFQVTDEHWMRAVLDDSMGKNEVSKCASKCASVPSGLGMNRVAQSFRSKSVTADSAMRNTHMHKQVGVTRWARQDSNLTSENPASDIENKENEGAAICGASKCASLLDKTTLIEELLSVLVALSPESQMELLRAALQQKQGESNND